MNKGIIKIKFTSGPMEGQTAELACGPVSIGRDAGMCELCVSDSTLSRQHCRLDAADDGGLTVSDCQSKNGTKVNGARIDRPVMLNPGDTVTIGATGFTAQLVDSNEAGAHPPAHADYTGHEPGVPLDDTKTEAGDDMDVEPTIAGGRFDPAADADIELPTIATMQPEKATGAPVQPAGPGEDFPTVGTLLPDSAPQGKAPRDDGGAEQVSAPDEDIADADLAPSGATLQISPEDMEKMGKESKKTGKVLGIIAGAAVIAALVIFLFTRGDGTEPLEFEIPAVPDIFENEYIMIGRPGAWSMEEIRNGAVFKAPQGQALAIFHTTAAPANAYTALDLNPRPLQRITEELLRMTGAAADSLEFYAGNGDAVAAGQIWDYIPAVTWHFAAGSYRGAGVQFYVRDLRVTYAGLWEAEQGERFRDFVSSGLIDYLYLKGEYEHPRFERPVVDTSKEVERPWEIMDAARDAMDYALELWENRRHEDTSIETAINYYKSGLRNAAMCGDYPAWVVNHMSVFFEVLEFRRTRLFSLQSDIIQSETLGEIDRARRLCEELELLASRRFEMDFRLWAREKKQYLAVSRR